MFTNQQLDMLNLLWLKKGCYNKDLMEKSIANSLTYPKIPMLLHAESYDKCIMHVGGGHGYMHSVMQSEASERVVRLGALNLTLRYRLLHYIYIRLSSNVVEFRKISKESV